MVPYTFKSRSVNPFILFIWPTAMLSVLVSLAALSSTSLCQNLPPYESTDMPTNNKSSHTRLGKSLFSVALQSGYSWHSSFHSRLWGRSGIEGSGGPRVLSGSRLGQSTWREIAWRSGTSPSNWIWQRESEVWGCKIYLEWWYLRDTKITTYHLGNKDCRRM